MLSNKMAVIETFTDPGRQQCYDCGCGHDCVVGNVFAHMGLTTAEKEIERQYADLIFDDAISIDETTLSYIYPISPELWILVLDPYIEIDHLHLSDETIEWLASYLDLARENHSEIIAMSHYGVTPSKETNLLLCYLNFQRSGGFGGNIV